MPQSKYTLRVVTQDDDGRYCYVGTPFIKEYLFNTFEEARDQLVPVFKVLASTLDVLHTNDTEEVWFEIIDTLWGAVAWEIRAKDCETLTSLPF